MEIRRGRVSSTRHTLSVSGGYSDTNVLTRHHAIFSLYDGTTVMFSAGGPAVIRDGDHLTVAGRQKGRVMKALAYRNETAGVKGDAGKWASLGIGFFALLFGVMTLVIGLLEPPSMINQPLSFGEKLIALVLGLSFCSVALYYFYRWLSISGAVKLLEKYY
ncbi:MAG: hypothetical protein QOH25_1776 [Acidobacteriota bacterium]|jgi:hypothetical protein|nr:hypothetical protein [Acidobacteriota bacterium]